MTRRPRIANATALSALLLALAGCQSAARPIFSAGPSPRSWPAPPDKTRIVHIGEIVGEESLHAPKRGLDALGELLTGPRPQARFVTPMAVAVKDARVYVADPAGEAACVHALDLDQRGYAAIRDVAGGPLRWPVDVAVCDELLAIADSDRNAVFLVDLSGRHVRTISGAGLQRPVSLAWDARRRELYVADAVACAVFVFDAGGQLARRFGARGADVGELHAPAGIGLDARGDSARVAVADALNFRAQVFSDQGQSLVSVGRKGDAAGDFGLPRDIAIDGDGNLHVLDNQFENVQLFNAQGQLLMAFGQEGSGPGEFWLPSGITIDDLNRIWIADTYNRRVQVFQYLAQESAE